MSPESGSRGRSRMLWVLAPVAIVALGFAIWRAPAEPPAGEEVTDIVADSTDLEAGDTGLDDEAAAGAGDAGSADAGTGEDDEAAAAAPEPVEPVSRDELVSNLVVNMTNHSPTDDEVACVVGEADEAETLGAVLDSLGANDGTPVNDEGFAALSNSLNGCVEGQVLADWAALTMGFSDDEVSADVSGCFNDRFVADDGDRNFRGLAAQALGFNATDEATSAGTIDTLSACVPLVSLADQLSSQTEARSGFRSTVDRECVTAALAGDELTRSFWSSVVSGAGEGFAQVDQLVSDCAGEYDSGLLKEIPAGFQPWQGTGALAAVDQQLRNGLYAERPPMSIDTTKTYEAIIATGGGEIRLTLFPETAPVTVNNFVSLAREGYYDGTVFHRVLADFMAQAGDPTGTGSGGPGYQFEDEVDGGPPLDRRGLLAMANSGPGTNGSQFFITFAPTEWLTGNHTVFGELISGDDILSSVELRDPQAPTSRGQVIESITIQES